jgi:signal transduction histidine kinase/PAS domain-containing protein
VNWIRAKNDEGRPVLAAYGIAILTVGLATGGRFPLDSILGSQYTHVTFFLAVLVTSGFGGIKPGLTALVLGALASSYFFTPPRHTFALGDPQHQIGLIAYLTIGITAVLMSEVQWRAHRRTGTALRQLEAEIREHKNTEGKLRELHAVAERRRAELDAIIESMPDAVYIGNENGITQCNGPALRMLGAVSLEDLQARIGELGTKFAIRWPHNNQLLKPEELQFNRALGGQTAIDEVLATDLKTGEDVYIRAASAPIIHDGRILGAVAINLDITRRKRKETCLQALSKLGQRLNTATTQTEAGRIISEVADELLGWDAFSLNRFNCESNEVHPILNIDTFNGQRADIPAAEIKPGVSGAIRRIMSQGSGELILKEDLKARLPESVPFGDTSHPSASLMFVPLSYQAKAIGNLSIQSYTPQAYDEDDLITLQALGDYCGGALERIRAEESLALSNERLSLIARVTDTIIGTAPIKDQVRALAQIVRTAYRVDSCVIRLLEGEELLLLATAGIAEDRLPPSLSANHGIASEMISRRTGIFIADTRAHPVAGACSEQTTGNYGFISYAGAPLIIQDRVIGLLGIYSEKQIRNFSDDDLEHLQITTHHIAAAIVNDSLYQEVSTQKTQLEHQIDERRQAGMEIERLNSELEKRVHERTEQLQASNRELEAFCYSVSHDLRWPLRTITGFGQALKDDYGDLLQTDGQECLERVINAGREMDRLINDLLHLSRLTRSDMKCRPVDLTAMAHKIARDLQQLEPDRRVDFLIAPRLTAHGDDRLLRVALENLLSNAWKFTGKRTHARIEFGRETGDGPPAYFVQDNGAGFDMAYAGKLFGAFQRLHGSSEFPGHGIGLATVQRIINRHGGRIWAVGEVDNGAKFSFSFPAQNGIHG